MPACLEKCAGNCCTSGQKKQTAAAPASESHKGKGSAFPGPSGSFSQIIHQQKILQPDMPDGARGVIDIVVGYDDPAVWLIFPKAENSLWYAFSSATL